MWQSLRKVYMDSRKPMDSVFNLWIARPLATPLVLFFEKIGFSPNQVTILGLWWMLLAGMSWVSVLWTPSTAGVQSIHLWVGLILVELAYVFDCVDGQLARRTNRTSRLGGELDFLIDELKAYVLVASLSTYWWKTGDASVVPLYWGVGGLVVVASALTMTRFVRSDVVQAEGAMGIAQHGDSAVARHQRSAFWWVLMPARLVTQYPQSLPIFFLFNAVDLFVMLYSGLHGIYAVGRLGQVTWRFFRR